MTIKDMTPDEKAVFDNVMAELVTRIAGGGSECIEGIDRKTCQCKAPGTAYIQFMREGHMTNPRRVYLCDSHFESLNKAIRLWFKNGLEDNRSEQLL